MTPVSSGHMTAIRFSAYTHPLFLGCTLSFLSSYVFSQPRQRGAPASPTRLNMNGQIVIASLFSSRKTRNIKRNNDVTVLIDTVNPFRGVLIYGKAELDYDNVYQQTVSVLEKAAPTVPREKVERFTQAYLDTVEFVIVKVTPKHMVTFDYDKDKIYSSLTKTYLK